MTSASKRVKAQPRQANAWWQSRRGRRRLFVALAIMGAFVLVAGFVWLNGRGGGMSGGGVPIGARVQAPSLEDSRTGKMFDLSQDIGKKDVVVVSYMGDFCLGCRELLVALQQRAPDFAAADADVVALGYETGDTGRQTAASRGITAYPLLQEGGGHSFTKSLGMWSDMMGMPYMGYVIIDKNGTILAGQQASLSEQPGDANANVDQILSALAATRRAGGAASPAGGGETTR